MRAYVVAHMDVLLEGLPTDATYKAALDDMGLAAMVHELQL